jgi:hypothetical protein
VKPKGTEETGADRPAAPFLALERRIARKAHNRRRYLRMMARRGKPQPPLWVRKLAPKKQRREMKHKLPVSVHEVARPGGGVKFVEVSAFDITKLWWVR